MNVLHTLADFDRLMRRPALIDIAHQIDLRPDRRAHKTRPLDFLFRRRVAGKRQLRFHLS